MAHVIQCKCLLDNDLGAAVWRSGFAYPGAKLLENIESDDKKKKTYYKKQKNLLLGGI